MHYDPTKTEGGYQSRSWPYEFTGTARNLETYGPEKCKAKLRNTWPWAFKKNTELFRATRNTSGVPTNGSITHDHLIKRIGI